MNSRTIKNILIIDDDEFSSEVIAATIERNSAYSTRFCKTAAEAYTYIERLSPNLILLDLLLPDQNGIDVVRKLKSSSITSGIPIIMISGDDEPKSQKAALQAGASLFLIKPVHSAKLKLHIDHLVG